MRRWMMICGLLLMLAPGRAWACPDLLLGDSLAVGMTQYARAEGYRVIAQTGAGLAWLRQQAPRCAHRLVLVFGTNDLRGMAAAEASAYPQQIAEIMERWPADRVIWATPGCFARDAALENGSALLDRALLHARLRSDAALAWLPAIHRGRVARCHYNSPDGVHPTADVYREWWQGLQAVMARRG